jgi:hypothetical protein
MHDALIAVGAIMIPHILLSVLVCDYTHTLLHAVGLEACLSLNCGVHTGARHLTARSLHRSRVSHLQRVCDALLERHLLGLRQAHAVLVVLDAQPDDAAPAHARLRFL